jgi:hypothetical protein
MHDLDDHQHDSLFDVGILNIKHLIQCFIFMFTSFIVDAIAFGFGFALQWTESLIVSSICPGSRDESNTYHSTVSRHRIIDALPV